MYLAEQLTLHLDHRLESMSKEVPLSLVHDRAATFLLQDAYNAFAVSPPPCCTLDSSLTRLSSSGHRSYSRAGNYFRGTEAEASVAS